MEYRRVSDPSTSILVADISVRVDELHRRVNRLDCALDLAAKELTEQPRYSHMPQKDIKEFLLNNGGEKCD